MSELAHTMHSELLDVRFLLSPHLLGISMQHRGEELLRAVEHVEQSATRGEPCGIPLLHPWANRLEHAQYRAGHKPVRLDMSSPLLRHDARGLPLHGVPWSLLRTVHEASDARAVAVRIDWDDDALLALFPFRHSLRVAAVLEAATLTVTTTLRATGDDHVPVSFGFHPYFGLPGSPRSAWRLSLPERSHLRLDDRGIPRGGSNIMPASDVVLGELALDDAFALIEPTGAFAIADDTRRVSVQCLYGYSHVQVYAPRHEAFVCFEPMTAPVNALCSGSGLTAVAPGEQFSAAFSIVVADIDTRDATR